MNVIDFAILSGLGQCFGYPRSADFIPTTDKMQHFIYTTLGYYIYYIMLHNIVWFKKIPFWHKKDIVKVQHRNLGLGLGLELILGSGLNIDLAII